jgi:hypothetical protein
MTGNCSFEKSGTHCTARQHHIPEAGTNTPTFRRNALPRSQDVKARSSSKLVHFLQTARRQIDDSITLFGESLAYLSNKTTFSKSPAWPVLLLCTAEWHGSLIPNYASCGIQRDSDQFYDTSYAQNRSLNQNVFDTHSYIIKFLCLRYPNTTALWILHLPGLSDTRQIASQILKPTLHLGLQHTSRSAVSS